MFKLFMRISTELPLIGWNLLNIRQKHFINIYLQLTVTFHPLYVNVPTAINFPFYSTFLKIMLPEYN